MTYDYRKRKYSQNTFSFLNDELGCSTNNIIFKSQDDLSPSIWKYVLRAHLKIFLKSEF